MPLTLTDRTVRGLDAGGRTQVDYWDSRLTGFGVRVSAEGRKTWVLRYRVQSGAGSSASDEPRDVPESGPG